MEKKQIRCYYCGMPLTFFSFDDEIRCPICETINARPLRFPDSDAPALPRNGMVLDHVDENGELMARIAVLPETPADFPKRSTPEESPELARAKSLARTDCSNAERLSFADVYLRAQNAGDANAQYKLGMFYLRGQYVSADAKAGMEWLNRAAASGSARARDQLKELGALPAREEIPSNGAEKLRSAEEEAPSIGDENACEIKKETPSQSAKKARGDAQPVRERDGKRDASSGDADQESGAAQSRDAVDRESGAAQSRDAFPGNPDERARLMQSFFGDDTAIALETLRFVRKNLTVAQRISLADAYIAATHGRAAAQFTLGTLFRDGRYVEPNPALAREWLQKAADQGYTPAQRALEALNRDNSPSKTDSDSDQAATGDSDETSAAQSDIPAHSGNASAAQNDNPAHSDGLSIASILPASNASLIGLVRRLLRSILSQGH